MRYSSLLCGRLTRTYPGFNIKAVVVKRADFSLKTPERTKKCTPPTWMRCTSSQQTAQLAGAGFVSATASMQ